jgi:glycosyltransferase involved in cell wall biosynthesis
VADGICGLVADPDPRSLAEVFDRLWTDRKLAAQLGRGAHERVAQLNINWGYVVRRLTA